MYAAKATLQACKPEAHEREEVCDRMSVLKKIEQQLNMELGKSRAKINKILSTVYGEDIEACNGLQVGEALPGRM